MYKSIKIMWFTRFSRSYLRISQVIWIVEQKFLHQKFFREICHMIDYFITSLGLRINLQSDGMLWYYNFIVIFDVYPVNHELWRENLAPKFPQKISYMIDCLIATVGLRVRIKMSQNVIIRPQISLFFLLVLAYISRNMGYRVKILAPKFFAWNFLLRRVLGI